MGRDRRSLRGADADGVLRGAPRAAGAGGGERGLRAAVGQLVATVWRLPDETASRRDVARLLALTKKRDEPELRLRTALIAALASPRFLFMEERGGRARRGEGAALTGVERAARLASMLWRSVPDERLLEAARGGELDTADGVAAVAGRMLGDPRADRFAASFGRQWLQLDGLRGKRADRKRFPDFDGRLARSMIEETERVLLDSLRERRSMWDLVDGTTTFVDERLARHYGLDALDGEPVDGGWRRVDLSGTERRGLLGHASVLFLTSEPERTSPVKRGKWVLDVLLGAAPPPPPPGVDSLPEDGAGKGEDGEELSLRERFELHRADPSCAACHARMDPIGFGLEAYDAVGALRGGSTPRGSCRMDAPSTALGARRRPAERGAVPRGHRRAPPRLRSCEEPGARRSSDGRRGRRGPRPGTPDLRGRSPRDRLVRRLPPDPQAMTDISRDIPVGELAAAGPASRHGRSRAGPCSVALAWPSRSPGSRPWRAQRRPRRRAPKRLVYVYVPNGVKLDQWRTALPTEKRGRWTVPLAGEHALKELPPLMRPSLRIAIA